ncbi:MAG: WecB/TagA/CpsF family glycosyltransferase [Thermonemataceae bacterium]|nr:WecB/TagA/CpsF family glycosyltransferase [Thermonemataceae bacterium]
MTFSKVSIFGVPYAVTDYEQASEVIIENAQKRNSYAVFALPVHGVVENQENKSFAEAVQIADMIVPDGQPIRWAMNNFYKVGLKDRVYGPLLTLYVLEKANILGLNVFLYGGATQEITDKFAAFIEKNYPNVKICGRYREEKPNESTLSTEQINKAGTHILLVGRGCPKQEIWVAEHKDKVQSVMMAVGAAFAFHAGAVKQAPKWMQNIGLEWLFRLMQEPKRLFKRYLVTNSYFIYLVIKYKIFGK